MEDLLFTIGNQGFPIVVSIYLLVRIEGKLENLSGSISDLAKNIEKLKQS